MILEEVVAPLSIVKAETVVVVGVEVVREVVVAGEVVAEVVLTVEVGVEVV